MAGLADIAKAAHLPSTKVKEVFDAIHEITRNGDKVTIQGFGKFEKKHVEARVGRNPKTGEEVDIPAKDKLAFKQAKDLEMGKKKARK